MLLCSVQALEDIKAQMTAVQKKAGISEEVRKAMAEKLVNELYAASGPAKLKGVLEQLQHALAEGKPTHDLSLLCNTRAASLACMQHEGCLNSLKACMQHCHFDLCQCITAMSNTRGIGAHIESHIHALCC